MEIIVRITIIYLFVLAGMRVLGKRELSQLSPLELISLMLIPEIVSESINMEDASLVYGLAGVATLLLLVFLTSLLIQHSLRAGEIIGGSPVVLAHNGRVIEDALNKERVTPEELYSEMRLVGIESLSQVKWAILETDGKISFIRADGGDHEPRHDDHRAA
jgi:uncharacterized membrane protein YcaP (DUF421 family)